MTELRDLMRLELCAYAVGVFFALFVLLEKLLFFVTIDKFIIVE